MQPYRTTRKAYAWLAAAARRSREPGVVNNTGAGLLLDRGASGILYGATITGNGAEGVAGDHSSSIALSEAAAANVVVTSGGLRFLVWSKAEH